MAHGGARGVPGGEGRVTGTGDTTVVSTGEGRTDRTVTGDEAREALMRVEGGSPTAEEAAAVEAVLVGMAEEWAQVKHRRVLDTETEWQAKTRTPTGHRWKRD